MNKGRVDVAFDFDFEVEVAFDLDFLQFRCADAFDVRQKMEKERPMFERSEFSDFPIF
ncbi:MAG: hypothetical protein V4495_06605 [Pseudomonadota bacterium]